MTTKRNKATASISIGFLVLLLGIGQIIFKPVEAHACEDILKKIIALKTQLNQTSAAEEKAERDLQEALVSDNEKVFKKADKAEKAKDKRSDMIKKKIARKMAELQECLNKKGD